MITTGGVSWRWTINQHHKIMRLAERLGYASLADALAGSPYVDVPHSNLGVSLAHHFIIWLDRRLIERQTEAGTKATHPPVR